jgi:hypothetical protein
MTPGSEKALRLLRLAVRDRGTFRLLVSLPDWPMSATSTPRRVITFIRRAMTVCSSAYNSSSDGALASVKTGPPCASASRDRRGRR